MPRTADEIVANAAAEQAQGRAWRAKEILRGAIASGRVQPPVLEAYGRLLDTLGDRVEAGKYLFASGRRAPEYAAPIALFKDRYAKNGYKHLIRQLPAAMRRLEFADLPETVRKELGDLGLTPPPPRKEGADLGPAARLLGIVFFVAVVLCLVALLVGFWTMGAWLWRAVFD